jgi:hypothetical protein
MSRSFFSPDRSKTLVDSCVGFSISRDRSQRITAAIGVASPEQGGTLHVEMGETMGAAHSVKPVIEGRQLKVSCFIIATALRTCGRKLRADLQLIALLAGGESVSIVIAYNRHCARSRDVRCRRSGDAWRQSTRLRELLRSTPGVAYILHP